ncbi:hypothetical protein JCM17961_38340 [Endothiovibrio diazotrophicus]
MLPALPRHPPLQAEVPAFRRFLRRRAGISLQERIQPIPRKPHRSATPSCAMFDPPGAQPDHTKGHNSLNNKGNGVLPEELSVVNEGSPTCLFPEAN